MSKKARKKARSGGKGIVYLCDFCGPKRVFASRAEAVEHEVEVHGRLPRGEASGLKRVPEHVAVRSCGLCGGFHTRAQHASHGHGSRARTHPRG